MSRVFHLAWSTCRATTIFVAGWRKLPRKVERRSALSNTFWLYCSFNIKLATYFRSTTSESTNQRAAFLQPITNVFFCATSCSREVNNVKHRPNVTMFLGKLRAFVFSRLSPPLVPFSFVLFQQLFNYKNRFSMPGKNMFYRYEQD